jgi:hypothetical protein
MARARKSHEWRSLEAQMNCLVCDNPAVVCVPANPRVAVCERADRDHANMAKFANCRVDRFQACIACADRTPATHQLVGCPQVRLCKNHYKGRGKLQKSLFRRDSKRASESSLPAAKKRVL